MVIRRPRLWSIAGFLLLPLLLLFTIRSSVAEKGIEQERFGLVESLIDQDGDPKPPPPDEGVVGVEINWANVSMVGTGPAAGESSAIQEVSPADQHFNAPQPEPQPISPPDQNQGPGVVANSPPPPDPGTSSATKYVVQRGDTLYQISLRFGVPQNVLASVNNIGWVDLIYAGQELVIPDGYGGTATTAPAPPAAPQPQPEKPAPVTDNAPAAAAHSTYIVQRGDSLGSISGRFGVDIGALITTNGLTNPNYIQAGQSLVITTAPTGDQQVGQPQSPAQQVAAVEDPEDSPAAAVDQAVADAEVSNPEPVEEQSSQPIRYTVQRGDSLLVIAGRYGVTLLAVIEANNLTNPDFIYPGQELTIPMGDEAEPTIEEAVETAPQETEQAAVPAKFLWPVKNYRIVNYYWAWHPGIDLVVDVGTTVVASAAGEVEFSDWNNYGYGYVVIINHGGGVRTLYAHNSELLVAAGDRVKQGQKISLSGSTGMSNWPHVHLEIIFNDLYRVNPCDHLPGACRE